MWHDLWVATALLLVLEGIIPFISPDLTRKMLTIIINRDDNALRYGGLMSMIVGVAVLYVIN